MGTANTAGILNYRGVVTENTAGILDSGQVGTENTAGILYSGRSVVQNTCRIGSRRGSVVVNTDVSRVLRPLRSSKYEHVLGAVRVGAYRIRPPNGHDRARAVVLK